MIWLDVEDPDVRAAVQTGKWGAAQLPELPDPTALVDVTATAVEVASEILTYLTGFKIHPGGESTEEFTVYPSTYRLTPNYLPIRSVTSLERLSEGDCTYVDTTEQYCIFNQSVYFSKNRSASYSDWLWRSCLCQCRGPEQVQLTYQFGSTITAGARGALVYFAHQLYLQAVGDEECQLPTGTRSVFREGIQYSIPDPADYLARAKTGLPPVDLWLAAVNPRRGVRPARVTTPDNPLGVGVSIRTIRA